MDRRLSRLITRATSRMDRRYAALRRGGGNAAWERYVESLDLLLRLTRRESADA